MAKISKLNYKCYINIILFLHKKYSSIIIDNIIDNNTHCPNNIKKLYRHYFSIPKYYS